MFLTHDELKELTGYTANKKQADWLRQNGYPFDTAATGMPKVLRSYVDARLGVNVTAKPAWRPNLAALGKRSQE